MAKKTLDIPERILSVIRADMHAYFDHGYSFEDFLDRNTNGRKYGDALKSIWKEEKGEEHAEV